MKVVTAEEAASMIQPGWTVAMEGFLGAGAPDDVARAAEKRFLETGTPERPDNDVLCSDGRSGFQGIDGFGYEGMTKCVIDSRFGPIPKMRELIDENKIEAHNWPQGVISHLYRAIAGNRPGNDDADRPAYICRAPLRRCVIVHPAGGFHENLHGRRPGGGDR